MAVLKDKSQDQKALLARIAELEAQVASGVKQTQCKPGVDKHGNKGLEFTGNFAPFFLTGSKCAKPVPYFDQIAQAAKDAGKAA